jgi:hypothetical protein
MKVMLDEIARKKAEAEQERLELERRRAEQGSAADVPVRQRPAGGRTA